MCCPSHKIDVASNEQHYSTEDIKKKIQDEYWKDINFIQKQIWILSKICIVMCELTEILTIL